jgi:hypothetical protein
VRNGIGRAAVITAALFAWAGGLARAEPVETSLSVTLNALSGHHKINGGHSDTLRFVHDRIDVWAAVNPRMRGVQYTRIPTIFFSCPAFGICAQEVRTFADPENASQVDLSARVAHRISKHGELLYGLRYLNYTAHYDDFPGQLADRNVGFAPVVGFRVRF